ncbi:hypothetical protein E4198_13960 [Streptomyces sp. RKND-216]|uniref:YDG/SRA domain-containing protein n=1 Tax=Streptomyces sp. RKND-216 TaxID=2562581 RepID=UPI00109DFEB5|nr:YDG/SRA domain-containing protein [Streptomyces sp. RKND-216]THA25661.1 hypothetical protein E4198_13960 [Streptomyces sp. RKND-216]
MPNSAKPPLFGDPPGVQEGDIFRSHAELYAADVHRFSGQGISGTEESGVDSIVLSGGYVDDLDKGDEIIYTGRGGRDRDSGNQIADQSLEEPGNAGLVVSGVLGRPVRVIEGLGISGGKRKRATKGYKYRGLYSVEDHWMTPGIDGFQVCQFRLVKLGVGEQPSPKPLAPRVDGETALEREARRYLLQQRLVRDTKAALQVKEMYNNTCQMCQERVVVSPQGSAYSEAAHIQAVGKPHNGPDIMENLLCLCPTCHVRFDRGALQLTDRYEVLDGLQLKIVNDLARLREHHIQLCFVRQHRNRWKGRFLENPL